MPSLEVDFHPLGNHHSSKRLSRTHPGGRFFCRDLILSRRLALPFDTRRRQHLPAGGCFEHVFVAQS